MFEGSVMYYVTKKLLSIYQKGSFNLELPVCMCVDINEGDLREQDQTCHNGQ